MSDTTGSPGPGTDGPGARPDEPDTSPAGADAPGDEQIEWQPVSDGDALTWQPVVSTGDEDVDLPPDEPGAWAGAAAATGAVASNGAAGAGYDPEPPAPRTPTGPRSVAARRRAQAAAAGGGGGGGGGSGRPPSAPAPPAKDKMRRQVILLSAATAAVVLVAVLAFVWSRGALDEGDQAGGPATTPTSVRTAPTLPESEFQGYRDDASGFSLRYPKGWVKYVPAASDYRLAVAIQPPDTDGFWVRLYPIQTEATEENIGNFKAVTDTVVFGDQSAKLIQEQLLRVNGRLAYYYLYTVEDPISRNQAIHAHYFIFEGLRMFSLIFQSVPADDFTRQAGIFDQIAESFVAEPPRPGATPTTTG